MHNEFVGIGAVLTDADGYCTIKELLPGGPAEASRQLEPEDVILKVAKGEGEFVFVAEVPGPEDKIAVRLVDGILYVRGTGGFSKEVPIEGANEMQIFDFKYRNGVLTLRIK